MDLKPYLKFIFKIKIIAPLRSLFLFIAGAQVNRSDWENRLLIINFEALGDLIVFTSVLKHYKKRFPDKKIYLLVKSGLGIEEVIKGQFADEVILLRYRNFTANPFYGLRFINFLRHIGFRKIINHDFSAAEPVGKIIAVNLGAEEIVGYEGTGLEYRMPFDIQQKKTIFYLANKIIPRYTKLIRRIDLGMPEDNVLPSAISHYVAIYEGATGFREPDYSTALETETRAGLFDGKLTKKIGVEPGKYVVVNFGASVSCKRWPARRFAETLNFFKHRIPAVVLIGSKKESADAKEFISIYEGKVIDLTGKTKFLEFLQIIKDAFFVFTNDSATVHAAVAMKVPSLCVSGGGQFGMFQDYGFTNINRWIYKNTWCYGDNWRCGRGEGKKLSPCLEAVTVEDAKKELEALLAQIGAPKEAGGFRIGRAPALPPKNPKMKIVYAGVESENYNPLRRPSFEYGNFYLSLKSIPGVSVIEYPYEQIVTLGKKKFNEDLLDLVRREKPDIFFAFMFTDELAPAVLEKIKQLTTSVAWFADDHWRIWNYSRHYARHFTWAVTTWSRAPEIYERYGIKNIIRSQWACNVGQWKPADVERDIEISFVGQYNPARDKIIDALRANGFDIWVKGFGWPEGRLPQTEMAKSFSRTKINLNFNTPPPRWSIKMIGRIFFKRSRDRIVPDFFYIKDNIFSWYHMKIPQIKARPFEILGCRAFLISAYADDMNKYYEDGKEAVYYDGTMNDLIGKIKYYLPRDEEREMVARAAYEKTIREHTYEKRFLDLFKKLGINF